MKNTEIEEYQTLDDLKKRGIKHKTMRQFLIPGDNNVYTYTVYCKDGTVWGFSSEDNIFTPKNDE